MHITAAQGSANVRTLVDYSNLENARCDIEESTDGDGDTHTHYYLRGTDETGKEYSFTVDEDVSSQISDGYVRVRYLPNTSVIMEVEY